MPRRTVLTTRQQARLLDLPTDAASLHEHYTLDDFDLEQIGQRRRAHNKMGFVLQLCALRYPGRFWRHMVIINRLKQRSNGANWKAWLPWRGS